MKKIAICSHENDLHAHAVKKEIESKFDALVDFICTDCSVNSGGITWSSENPQKGLIKNYYNEWVDISALDIVWWRRVNQPLQFPAWLVDPVDKDFLTHEWRGGFAGVFFDAFKGVWINNPANDSLAANKLYQLTLAKECGLKIPRTLISQQPEEVRRFCQDLKGKIVAKKITGSTMVPTASITVTLEELFDDYSIRLCPAIYQEIIYSSRHLRVNCFGHSIHSLLIKSETFDWRRKLDVPFLPFKLDSETEDKLRLLLKKAGIKMGIMDMILDEDDKPIWLELNPQGQFLFGEALSGYNLTSPFAEFLYSECKQQKL